jgi:hypothetical protein
MGKRRELPQPWGTHRLENARSSWLSAGATDRICARGAMGKQVEKKSIVLVLGAGASKAYGYPLGSELRHAILNLTEPNALEFGVLHDWDTSVAVEFTRFRNAFRQSNLYSIDAFLGKRKEFESIGKKCIAAILLSQRDCYRHMG